MSTLNFLKCPLCGSDLEVAAEEDIAASNHLKLTIGDDGELKSAEFGVTEPRWDTSETILYRCDVCMEPLPEEYQQLLDEVLGNERVQAERR